MKKSLVALAVLAVSGAAMAQSSVTLYGRLDAGLGQVTTETTGANPKASLSQNVVTSSALKTTFWGLKGTEDLGGGLSAIFQLESQFNMDDGAIAAKNTLFERQATVGLSGGFGTVKLGRIYTTQYDLFAATDNIANGNVSTSGTVYGTGIARQSVRAGNAIKYDSPSFGGVKGSAFVSMGEDKTATTSAAGMVGLNVSYSNGPLMVGYGHQEEKLAQAVSTTPQVTNKYDMIGGTYDLGVAKFNAAYEQSKNGTLNDKEYNLGAIVPMSAAASLWVGYSHSNSTGGAKELTSSGFTIAGTYSLSKRTTLYAGYVKTDIEANTKASATSVTPVVNAGFDKTKTSTVAAGVVHTF